MNSEGPSTFPENLAVPFAFSHCGYVLTTFKNVRSVHQDRGIIGLLVSLFPFILSFLKKNILQMQERNRKGHSRWKEVQVFVNISHGIKEEPRAEGNESQM